ncbi:MAG: YgjV family protein [Ruminococcaceae bacterium]|nr:YgjV family protein [Oscillospiraceae bacterium]
MKLASDILGYIATLMFIISFQLPKRKYILSAQAVTNFLGAVNVLLIAGLNSAVLLNLLGAIHIIVIIEHCINQKESTKKEKILFFILYVAAGLIGLRKVIDIIPLIGTLFFMGGVFQTKEQNIRIFNLVNILVYLVYYAMIGSTLIYAQIFATCSVLISLFRYRTKKV